jgi:uncharacterized repeat protein (TIGR01451 family)
MRYMNKKLYLCIAAMLICFTAGAAVSLVQAEERSSSGYTIETDALTSGGTTSESTGYSIEGSTLGQPVQPGSMESVGYKEYGGFQETLGTSPDAPTGLAQYRSDGVTSVGIGEWLNGDTFVMKFNMFDPDPSNFIMAQVEIRATQDAFTGNPNYSGTEVPFAGLPVAGVVTVGPISDNTAYHWQARVIDDEGRRSPWVSFGTSGEAYPDFGTSSSSPTVEVIQPNGYEGYIMGTTCEVKWTASHMSGITNIAIRYSTGEGYPWFTVSLTEPNDGSYVWTVPSIRSQNYRISIEATAGNGSKAWDTSNNVFLVGSSETYFSNSGNDSTGTGTVSNPYLTAQTALNWTPSYGKAKAFGGIYAGSGNKAIMWPKRSYMSLVPTLEASPATIDATGTFGISAEVAVQLSIESFTIKNCFTIAMPANIIYLPPGSRIDLNKDYFLNNVMYSGTGGIVFAGGYGYATNCTFINNSATTGGSDTTFLGGTFEATNCLFDGALAGSGNYGAGSGDKITLTNCVVRNCYANWLGALGATNGTISGCTFESNHVAYNGAVIGYGTWNISNSWFNNNWSNGGAIIFNATINATNCAFVSNDGGVFMNTTARLTNCSLANNTASYVGGDIAVGSTINSINSIFWGGRGDIFSTSSGTLTNSIVMNGDWSGFTTTACSSAEPYFVNFYSNDLRLCVGSSALNTGTSAGAPSTAIDGTSRPQGAGYDMGIFEQSTGIPLFKDVYVSTTGSDLNDGSSWVNALRTVQLGLNKVSSEGTVHIAAGIYQENDLTFSGRNNVRVSGESMGTTTIDAQTIDRAFTMPIAQTVTFESMTIKNGKPKLDYSSNSFGGALYVPANSSVWLKNVMMTNCIASGGNNYGGAVYCVDNTAKIYADNCIFDNNYASQGQMAYGTWTVTSSIFRNNTNSGVGGIAYYGNWDVTNTLFYNNSSASGGGIAWYGNWKATNCTFFKNTSGSGSIGYNTNWKSKNSIYNNNATLFLGGVATIEYSDVQTNGYVAGTGNVSSEPFFVSTLEANLSFLRLAGGSPCIDSGTSEGAPSVDKIGNTRPRGFGYDMGIYEFQGPSLRIVQPNGGEILYLGQPYVISWESSPVADTGTVNISLSTNEGLSWTLISTGTNDTHSYNWTVNGAITTECRISIEASLGGIVNRDISDNKFTISVVLYPATNLTAEALPVTLPTYVKLYWKASTAEAIQGYYIYRGTAEGIYSLTPLNATPTSELTYIDSTVLPGHDYFYVIRTYGWGSYSPYSNMASAPQMKMTRGSTVEAPISGGYSGGAHDAVPGATIRYTTKYENIGFAPSLNIVIIDKVPNNTNYKVGSATGEAANNIRFSNNNGSTYTWGPSGTVDPQVTNVSWEVQNVKAGGSKLVTFEVVIR